MNETVKTNSVSDEDIIFAINTISGVVTMPFWDAVREKVALFESVKSFMGAFEALHQAGKDEEAVRMFFAINDMVELDWPEELDLIVLTAELSAMFMDEFLSDTEDLMYDYEVEEEA
jgi:hypothetical protein